MSFLGLGILIIVDILLITATIIDKIRDRYKNKRPKARKEKKGFGGGAFGRNNKKYQELHDDHSMEEGSIAMEPRLDFRRRPTGFEQMGAMEADFVLGDELHDANGANKTDLQEFVQSLSRILGATKFGLSFEFQNLHFQPPKNPKPILSDVTGLIDAGSLWGVMGASGAGKCEFTLT
jgi:ABC-type glutathione transport system ATPase component